MYGDKKCGCMIILSHFARNICCEFIERFVPVARATGMSNTMVVDVGKAFDRLITQLFQVEKNVFSTRLGNKIQSVHDEIERRVEFDKYSIGALIVTEKGHGN